MTNSQHPISDERWSAYLDGQLSPEETAQLDERLATDEVARRAVEELRQLRESLRTLPRPTLGRSFTDRVMQQVRSVSDNTSDTLLSSPNTVMATDSTGKPSGGATSDMNTSGDSTGWRRGIIWAALAVAASIVVLLRTPAPDRNATIGKLPPTADDSRGFSTAEQEAPPVPAPVGEPAPASNGPTFDGPASDGPVLAAPRDQSSDHRFRSTDEFHSERERGNGRDRGGDNSRYHVEAERRERRPAVSLGMETPEPVAPEPAVPQPVDRGFTEPAAPAPPRSVSPTAPGAPAARGERFLGESEEKKKEPGDFRELAGEGDGQSNAPIERPIAGKATADGEGLDQPTNRLELDAKAGIAGATTAEDAGAIAGANAGAEEVVLLEAEVSPERLPTLYGNLMNRYSWSDRTPQDLAIQTQAAPEQAAPEQSGPENATPVPSVPEKAALAESESGKAESVAEDAHKEEPAATDAPTGDVSGISVSGGGQQNLGEGPAPSAVDHVDTLAGTYRENRDPRAAPSNGDSSEKQDRSATDVDLAAQPAAQPTVEALAEQSDERQALELFYKRANVAPELVTQFGAQRGVTPNFSLQAASVEETVKEVQANQQPKVVWFFVDLPPEDVEQEVRQQGRVLNNSVVTPVPLVVQQNVNQALVQNNASVANNYFHFQLTTPTTPTITPQEEVADENAAASDSVQREDLIRETELADGEGAKQPSNSNGPIDAELGRSLNRGTEANPALAKDFQEEAADKAADDAGGKAASDTSAANNTLADTDAGHDKPQAAARELTERLVEGRSKDADTLSHANRSTGNAETDADFALRQQNASPEAAQATTNGPAGTNGEEVLLQRSYANDQIWSLQDNGFQNNHLRNSSAQNNRYGTNRRVVLWLRVVPDPPPVASPSPVP